MTSWASDQNVILWGHLEKRLAPDKLPGVIQSQLGVVYVRWECELLRWDAQYSQKKIFFETKSLKMGSIKHLPMCGYCRADWKMWLIRKPWEPAFPHRWLAVIRLPREAFNKIPWHRKFKSKSFAPWTSLLFSRALPSIPCRYLSIPAAMSPMLQTRKI